MTSLKQLNNGGIRAYLRLIHPRTPWYAFKRYLLKNGKIVGENNRVSRSI
jgi:hypothetical protein